MVPEKRVEHISALRPEICTLDLNTMTFGKEVVINTPPNVRRMAKIIREAGVKPEVELFDSGDIALMADLVKDGTLTGPHLVSIVMGVRYGFQFSPETVLYARGLLPADTQFTAFGTGRGGFPRSLSRICRADTCVSVLKTACRLVAAFLPTRMRRWWKRHATSSRNSGARSRRQPRPASCSDFQNLAPVGQPELGAGRCRMSEHVRCDVRPKTGVGHRWRTPFQWLCRGRRFKSCHSDQQQT